MIGRTNACVATATGDWIRPSDWLEIDSLVTAGEQKIVGLYAIYPNNNELSMTNTVAFVATGNYTVDWGDGSALENVNSNVQAQHLYDYDTISSATACTRGYRQAIITITPQSGENITQLLFGRKHSSVVFGRISSQWLDLVIGGTAISYFRMQDQNVFPNLLEKVKGIQTNAACTNMSFMFYNCNSLQSLNLSSFNTSSVTNMGSMFYNCYSLQSLDLSSFNTSAVTNMIYMFYNCYSLQSLDLSSFNTSAVTNMSYMFNGCTSLQSLNLSSFNTSSVTNMSYMFANCYSLQSLDLSSFNTAAVTTMANMFANSNYVFLDLSMFNTSKVINMERMFNETRSLQYVKQNFNTSAVNNMTYMFWFTGIRSFDLSTTNVANLTSFLGSFNNTGSLIKVRLPQIKISFSVQNNPLSAAELNLLFGDLADLTGLTAQTITITGCTGAATCDKTIATSKNWTVIG